VSPLIDAWALTMKIWLALLALIVSLAAPGPWIVSVLVIDSAPWLNVIGEANPGAKAMVPPLAEALIASRKVQVLVQLPGPGSPESLTVSVAACVCSAQTRSKPDTARHERFI
jgi:hypothetical protein